MKLDPDTIAWIEEALGEIVHGEARLIVCDKQIVKIIIEQHKAIDKSSNHVLDSG